MVAGAAANQEEPKPEPTEAATGGEGKNPFGWKPIPANPFPLPMPERPTTLCRVVAWRLDGDPVDAEAFSTHFGAVPAEMGDVVDFDTASSSSSLSYRAFFGISPAGKVISSRAAITSHFESIKSVARLHAGNNVCIVLASDGSASAFVFKPRNAFQGTRCRRRF